MSINYGNKEFDYVYVGCRTSRYRNARGNGINVYKVDKTTGKWDHIQLVGEIDNPAFLAFDNEKKYLYSVQGDRKLVTAYSINRETGKLTLLGSQATGEDFVHSALDPSRGFNPVYIAVDSSNKYLIIPNLASGRIAVLPRNEDGTLGKFVCLTVVPGAETKEGEEPSFSRPHQICFDATGKYIAVPMQGRPEGKGVDKIVVYSFNKENGELKEVCSVKSRKGSWPRHLSFHKNNKFAYVINEMENSVTSYTFDDETGTLTPFQVLPSLPDTYFGEGQASEIEVHPNGKFVYASNRIHESIVIYKIDQETGRLNVVGWEFCLGKTPRFTAIDPSGKYFYSANEDSDDIVEFNIDSESGKLTPTGQVIKTESPTCIIFL